VVVSIVPWNSPIGLASNQRNSAATIRRARASLWTRDVDRALGLAERLEAGTIWINAHGTGAINRRAPYGGVKQSGIGRKSGLEGVLEYIALQTVTAHE